MATVVEPDPETGLLLLGIVGPTGAGKSQLALELATKLSGEIVAADSRTVYRGLSIGTAKPTAGDQRRVRHHLLDVAGPGDDFSVARFQALAEAALAGIARRRRWALVVGGSGLYVDSLLWGYRFGGQPADRRQRQQLSRLTIEQLQQLVDCRGLPRPENWRNRRYLVRTLERGDRAPLPLQLRPGAIVIGLEPPATVLRRKLAQRWESMLAAGVIDEARWAWDHYPPQSEALKGNIYRSLRPYLSGQTSLEAARDDFLRRDWQLARRQLAWWRRRDNINWFADSAEAFSHVDDPAGPVNGQ